MASAGSERQRRSSRRSEGGQRGTPEETSQAILGAAKQRFLHYGYKKTTIDEIAADAGVGKGTVYLYFDGKDEIMLLLILEVKRNITEQMRSIAAALGSPEDKLRRMILACITTVYDACNATAHGSEFVDDIMPNLMKRPPLRDRFWRESEAQLDVLAAVLREGNESRVFDVPDVKKTASLLSQAFVSFFPPYTFKHCPAPRTREEMAAGAAEMMDLLVRGLRRCP